jgi:hypothetical protein
MLLLPDKGTSLDIVPQRSLEEIFKKIAYEDKNNFSDLQWEYIHVGMKIHFDEIIATGPKAEVVFSMPAKCDVKSDNNESDESMMAYMTIREKNIFYNKADALFHSDISCEGIVEKIKGDPIICRDHKTINQRFYNSGGFFISTTSTTIDDPVGPSPFDIEIKRDIDEKIITPYLGILVGSDGPLAIVTGVFSDSPAEMSGIKRGDIIVSINGERIPNAEYLAELVKQYKIGKDVEIKIIRNNKSIDIKTVIGSK